MSLRTVRSVGYFAALCAVITLNLTLATAQALTGAVFGTVKDASGAILPMAAVRIISPAVFGGRLSATTNDKGQFRLLELPPGIYRLEIESPGFATYREDGVRVGVAATIERSVILPVAAITESIDVAAPVSTIDTRKTGLSSRFGSEEMREIPVRRFSIFDWIKAAPGISPTSPSGGNTSNENNGCLPLVLE